MEPSETLYVNARVRTMDGAGKPEEALLVRGHQIAAVGTRDTVEGVAGRTARRIDLNEQTVVPGFNDCHCHVLTLGLTLDQIDLTSDTTRSIGDIVDRLARRAAQSSTEEWLFGRGYDQNMLAEGRHPTKEDLDAVTPNHPVVLWHTSGHVLTANTRALELAGVGRETDSPPGGEIDRDQRGFPTGLMKESAMDLIGHAIPPPTEEQGTGAICRATALMAGFGITSATDAATGHGPSAEPELAMYRKAAKGRGLAVRVDLLPQIAYVAPPQGDEARSPADFDVGDDPNWLAVAGTKIFSDGALSTRTAALLQPYAGEPANAGILLWDQEVLQDMMRRAHAAGWRIATHALGDRAVEAVLDAYGVAMRGKRGQDHRHRIEHCMLCDERLAWRIRDLGVVPVLQPDIFRLGDGYITALGRERADDVIPMRLFERLQIPVAFSSDAPVVPCDPLAVVRSAVERRTPGGMVLGRQHAVTPLEAIRLYTAGSAYATRRERTKGVLRPGLLADFTVLSHDPAAIAPQEFDDLRVTMTVVGGNVAYER